jgi:hypothetical protein
VGKTTLLAQIEKRLAEMLPTEEASGQRHGLPVLRLDAVSPEQNQFKWGDYYQRALVLLQEPRVQYTLDYHHQLPQITRTLVGQEPFLGTNAVKSHWQSTHITSIFVLNS